MWPEAKTSAASDDQLRRGSSQNKLPVTLRNNGLIPLKLRSRRIVAPLGLTLSS
jgi:hypothetical protein